MQLLDVSLQALVAALSGLWLLSMLLTWYYGFKRKLAVLRACLQTFQFLGCSQVDELSIPQITSMYNTKDRVEPPFAHGAHCADSCNYLVPGGSSHVSIPQRQA